jgi:hypothetical protein
MPDVCTVYGYCMESNEFPAKLTKTMLVLILNGDNPNSMKDYRPIALCNVLYKIIAKAILTD